jgi:AAA15 family ATPase/GTPase
MIRSFYIDNFKSLVNFRLPPAPHALGPFVCLVGLNGAGKSTVLQALDFVAHLAQGKVQQWLDQREWKKGDLTSRFLSRQLIRFRLEFEFSSASAVGQCREGMGAGTCRLGGKLQPVLDAMHL